MLHATYIRANPDTVKQACINKQLDPNLVDKFLKADKTRRRLIGQVEEIQKEINQHAREVKAAVQSGGRPSSKQIDHGKQLKIKLKRIEPELKEAQANFDKILIEIPNIPADEVPVGKDETGNIVVKTTGDKPVFEFEPQPHHQLMESLDMLDTKRAVKIGGFRSYFLKGDGVMLEQAILQYSLKLMMQHGFTPFTAPVLVNREAMQGTGYFPWGQDDHYYTQDDQILAGTSEVALTSYHQGETLSQKDLPIKLVGISPCFRREIGSHGKDTQGIVRVHQFSKVEQVVYTIADEAETKRWHEKMLGFSEKLLQDLRLPYQVLLMCTGDMGAAQRKKFDIETWFPSQKKYRETHSASYFNDFQSRRLNIRYQAKDGSTKHVYTLNNTVAATPRLLAAVVENYQQADGSLEVPQVLQEFIGKKNIAIS